ncbi:MAG: DUF418 domain-containing protein [Phycisphaerales bacterium]
MNTDFQSAPPQTPAIGGSRAVGSPVPEATRHLAMDTARGLALLGIFMVNIQFFAASFLDFFEMTPPAGTSPGGVAVFYFTSIFCQSKSYPLFSLLFGMGLALQMGRAKSAGRSFFPLYLRRLAALALFGLLHIVFLWYGDILLFYAMAGFVLLLLSRLSAKWLLGIAAGIIGLGTLLGTALGVAMVLSGPGGLRGEPAPEPAAPGVSQTAGDIDPEAMERRTPIERLFNPRTMQGTFGGPGGPSGEAAQSPDNPATRTWNAAEAEAFRDGPFMQAMLVRLLFWFMMFMFSIFSFLWHVLAMFCIGAALVKLRIFDADRAVWRRRFAIWGLGLGIPVAVLISFAPIMFGVRGMALLNSVGMFIVPTLVALGYFGAMAWLCDSGRLARITGVLAATGRMALTNYLFQSVIAGFVMYHWGLAQFGTFDRVERATLVVGVYACQLVFSVLWLRYFRFGPMEWLWRSMTYLKLQPMRRTATATATAPVA